MGNVKGITSIKNTQRLREQHQQQTQSSNNMYTLYTMCFVCAGCWLLCHIFFSTAFHLILLSLYVRCLYVLCENFSKSSFDSDRLFYIDDFPNFMGFVSPQFQSFFFVMHFSFGRQCFNKPIGIQTCESFDIDMFARGLDLFFFNFLFVC